MNEVLLTNTWRKYLKRSSDKPNATRCYYFANSFISYPALSMEGVDGVSDYFAFVLLCLTLSGGLGNCTLQ